MKDFIGGKAASLTWIRKTRSITVCCVVCIAVLFSSFAEGQESLPEIIRRISPSVVVVLTQDKEGRLSGQASGFFFNEEGDVITNYHVLEGASGAAVRTAEGDLYPAKRVVAEDRDGDLVRLSVDLSGRTVRPLPLVRSMPEVGERIFVVGTPMGLEMTVSDGIVAAVRQIPEFGRIVQVTAPISVGSSGSPVVNMKGEVIGIATFFVLAGQNLNFAIPAERIAGLSPGRGRTLSERQEVQIEERMALAQKSYAMGVQFLWVEEWEKALLFFLEALSKNPNHAETHFQIGYCKSKLERYSEAVESYQEAVRLKPDGFDSHNNLCVVYNRMERFEDALRACSEAIRLRGDAAEPYNNLAWSYHRQGRYHDAIRAAKEAIRIKPDLALAHYNFGNSLFALGQYQNAMESFKETIRLNFDSAEGHLNLGAAYFKLGRYEEAIQSYQEAVRIRPLFPEGHLNLGMAYLRLGDRASALKEYGILKGQSEEFANRLFNLIYD